uniref:CRISPR-associated endonuclease Cas1 n=1 Tax=Crenothrix polyspora TaxID=360316 RepID=UPI000B3592AF
MSSLYLDRQNLALKLDGKTLALYENDVKQGTIPLHLLERIVVQGNIQLEGRVLGALSERNIGLLMLSRRSTEATAMLMANAHGDAKRRLGQYQTSLDESARCVLARWLVLVKVRGQQRMLQQALKQRADCRHPLTSALQTLTGILESLRAEDKQLSLASLRGYEGSAAAAYFAALIQLFAPAL